MANPTGEFGFMCGFGSILTRARCSSFAVRSLRPTLAAYRELDARGTFRDLPAVEVLLNFGGRRRGEKRKL